MLELVKEKAKSKGLCTDDLVGAVTEGDKMSAIISLVEHLTAEDFNQPEVNTCKRQRPEAHVGSTSLTCAGTAVAGGGAGASGGAAGADADATAGADLQSAISGSRSTTGNFVRFNYGGGYRDTRLLYLQIVAARRRIANGRNSQKQQRRKT